MTTHAQARRRAARGRGRDARGGGRRSRRCAAAGPVAIVHGGGRAIDADLKARGKAPQFVDGLRVTDDDTLDTVVAVLAGRINTAFVAALGAAGVKAVGLTGADASLGTRDAGAAAADDGRHGRGSRPRRRAARRRAGAAADRPDRRSATCRSSPASASDADGALLNVNADTLAAHLARRGRRDAADHRRQDGGRLRRRRATPARRSTRTRRAAMVAAGTARDGMVAKLGACLDALDGRRGGSADRGRPRRANSRTRRAPRLPTRTREHLLKC